MPDCASWAIKENSMNINLIQIAQRTLLTGASVAMLSLSSGCANNGAEDPQTLGDDAADPDADLEAANEDLRANFDVGTSLEVTASKLNLRDAPKGAVLKLLPRGTELSVVKRGGADGWVKVEANGSQGFVSTDFVTRATGGDSGMTPGADPAPAPLASGGTCDPSRAQGAVNRFQKGLHDAIAFAEGTKDRNKDGYNVGFAYKIFSSCRSHPNINTCSGICSTAAGRYQFLKKTWSPTASAIGASTFEPENQEKGAQHLVTSVRRVNMPSGRALSSSEFSNAMSKLSYEWASLPPGRYGQPKKSVSTMRTQYCAAVPGGC
jgi:muramidase (phage lysozyme)